MTRTRSRVEPAYPRERRRLHLGRWLVILILVLLAAGVGVALSLLPAARAAQDARTQLRAIEADRAVLHHVPTAAEVAALDARVVKLQVDLRDLGAAWSRWRRPALFAAHLSPALHAQLDQVDPLLAYGAAMTAAAHTLAAAAPPILAQTAGHGAAPRLIAQLAAAHPAIARAGALLRQAAVARGQITPAGLPSFVRSGLATVDSYAAGAPAALDALNALPAALGQAGARDYLLVPENSRDLRGSGGFIATVGVLHVDHGAVSLQHLDDAYNVDMARRPNVDPPLPMEYYGWYSFYFRDAGWSVDFPTTAQLLEIEYRLGTGRHVDGVIAVTPPLLAALLDYTGPIAVSPYPQVLDAGNAFSQIDFQVNANGTGKIFALAAYRSLFARLTSSASLADRRLLGLLRDAAAQRALLLYADDPAVQGAIRTARADSAVDPTRRDYLYLTDTNVSSNKVNGLIRESVDYRAAIQPDRGIRATLRIRYTNTADAAQLHRGDGYPYYKDFIRVLVPAGSSLLAATGLDTPWASETVHHKRQFAGYLHLNPHESRTVVFSYRIPPGATYGGRYELLVQRQPGAVPVPLTLAVSAARGLRLGAGQPLRLATTFVRDLTLGAPLSGGPNPPVPPAIPPDPPVAPGSHPEPWLQAPATSSPAPGLTVVK